MARKRKYRKKKNLTIPMAPIIGILGMKNLIPAVDYAVKGNLQGATMEARKIVGIGGDGKFYLENLTANMGPVVLGLLVHKFVGGNPLNLNRTLASAGVPFIRI